MLIYKTTNLINYKIYIGKQLNNNREKYLGSGTLLKRAIKKIWNRKFHKRNYRNM